MPWLKIMFKIFSPGALHLLLDFDNFNTKEDLIQDIFRDLGLGETFFKVVSQSELPAKIFETHY